MFNIGIMFDLINEIDFRLFNAELERLADQPVGFDLAGAAQNLFQVISSLLENISVSNENPIAFMMPDLMFERLNSIKPAEEHIDEGLSESIAREGSQEAVSTPVANPSGFFSWLSDSADSADSAESQEAIDDFERLELYRSPIWCL